MAAGDRAVVEAIVRVRDEATKEFAAITKNLAGQAKTMETAFSSASRAGLGDLSDQLEAMKTRLAGLAAPAAGAASGLGSLAGLLGPAGIATAAGVAVTAVAAYAAAVEQAAQEQAKFNRALEGFSPGPFIAGVNEANDRMALLAERSKSTLGSLREVLSEMSRQAFGGKTTEQQREENLAAARPRIQAAETERIRRAEVAGLRQEEADARRAGREDEATRKAQQRLQIEQDILNAQQAARRDALKDFGISTAGAEASERANLVRGFAQEQQQQADRLAKQEEQRQQKLAREEEQRAQRRLQNTLQLIQGEQQIEVATAQATARRDAAEAKRLGNLEAITQAELAGLLRVRDAQLKAITDAANVRAQAARGPGREDDVLAIRQKEAQDTLQVNLATAAKVEDAWRAAQQRVAEQQRKQIADTQTAWDALIARMTETGQTTARPSDLLFGQFDADEQRRKALIAQDVFAQGGSISKTEAQAIKGLGLPSMFGGGLADNFAAASVSADKLTRSVEGLATALKSTGEAAPNLVQAISQGLADALTFAGQRHP